LARPVPYACSLLLQASAAGLIVQAAAEVPKYARMRLNKGNAWDNDKDKFKDTIVNMRE
jgi:hypothetical protein